MRAGNLGLWAVVDAVADSGSASPAMVQAVSIIGTVVITFGYPISVETITRGRTLGLWALGLRACATTAARSASGTR